MLILTQKQELLECSDIFLYLEKTSSNEYEVKARRMWVGTEYRPIVLGTYKTRTRAQELIGDIYLKYGTNSFEQKYFMPKE